MRIKTLAGVAFMLVALIAVRSYAGTSTLLITGDEANGVSGGVFQSFQPGALNDNGKITFQAELQLVGGVTSSNNKGIWSFASGAESLVARTGSGGVPQVAGADFETFGDFAIDSVGDIYVLGTLLDEVGLVTNDDEEGIWRFSSGSDELIVRQGVTSAPGVPPTTFSTLPDALRVAGDGRLAFEAILNIAIGVSNQNDRGVWSYDDLGGTLIARMGVGPAPGVSGFFKGFSEEVFVNDDQQIAFPALVDVFDPTEELGLWGYTNTSGDLIARAGIGGVPDIDVTSFSTLGEPAINGSDQIAFAASLTQVGSVDTTNDAGLWLYEDTIGSLLAQRGSGDVAGISGADFESFERPLLGDSGVVLVGAELMLSAGVVSASDNRGLWTFDGVTSSMVARSGSGGVPGVAGASFAEFTNMSLNSAGDIALHASLQTGGSIDPNNDGGLWVFDSQGKGILVAREGDQLEGRTIASLDFLGGSGGNDGVASGFNDQGQLLFRADFKNGDSGLFLFQALEADFDGDGDVDRNDLTDPVLGWEVRFGADLDAGNFLEWQRAISGSAAPLSSLAAVPEPVSAGHCCVLLLSLACRRRII